MKDKLPQTWENLIAKEVESALKAIVKADYFLWNLNTTYLAGMRRAYFAIGETTLACRFEAMVNELQRLGLESHITNRFFGSSS